MTTKTFYPAASGDDGYSDGTALDLTSTGIPLGNDGGDSINAAIRFPNITIPMGAVVSNAYVKLTAKDTLSADDVNLGLRFNDADDPAAPTTQGEIETIAGALTTAYTAWLGVASWTDGTQYDSPDIKTSLQEIFDRPGWEAGNAVLLIIYDNTTSTASAKRTFSAYDFDSASEKAELHVEYDIIEEISESLILTEGLTDLGYRENISESLVISESTTDYIERTITLSESLFVWEQLRLEWEMQLAESLVVTDAVTPELLLIISDYVKFIGTLHTNQSGTITISDIIKLYESDVSWIRTIAATLSETLELTDAPTPILLLLLNDYIAVREIVSNNIVGGNTISETITITDNVFIEWLETIVESLGLADAATPELILLLSEYLAIREIVSSNAIFNQAVSETLAIGDSTVAEWLVSIAESIVVSDATTPDLTVTIAEYLEIRDALSSNAVFNNSVAESIVLADSIIAEWVLGLVESLGLADALTFIRTIDETLAENIAFSDLLSGLGVYNVTISDTLTVSDSIKNIISLLLSEGLVLTDTPASLREIYLALSESLGMADALSTSMEIYLSVSENIILVDTVTNTGTLCFTVQEGIALNVSVTLDNDVYECWVLNTPNFYPSAYTGFDFNSYCEFNGRSFGANSTGIYELTGNDDAGETINTGVVLNETNFGIPNQKRFRKAYLGVSGDAPVMMTENENGERNAYSVETDGGACASRDIKGAKWKLSVANFDELDFVNLVPVILAKRMK